MCIFHKYRKVEDTDHTICGRCFVTPNRVSSGLKEKYPNGYCPHSFKVCVKCGKAVGYGSHGKLSLVPDTCKKQVESMKR